MSSCRECVLTHQGFVRSLACNDQLGQESRRLCSMPKEECNKFRRQFAINCYSSKDSSRVRLLYGRHTKCSAFSYSWALAHLMECPWQHTIPQAYHDKRRDRRINMKLRQRTLNCITSLTLSML